LFIIYTYDYVMTWLRLRSEPSCGLMTGVLSSSGRIVCTSYSQSLGGILKRMFQENSRHTAAPRLSCVASVCFVIEFQLGPQRLLRTPSTSMTNGLRFQARRVLRNIKRLSERRYVLLFRDFQKRRAVRRRSSIGTNPVQLLQ
jgi:hypothetical protein